MRDDVTLAAVAALFAAQRGAATRRQLDGLGLDARRIATRLRHRTLVEAVPGVLVDQAVPESWHQRVQVATLAAGGTIASHRSAARLHGLDGCCDDLVEVSAPRRVRLPGIVVHEAVALERRDCIELAGIPTTGLARTLADLGSVCDPDQVLQALDDARRRRTNMRWLRQTAERLHRPGQAGTGTLLRLLTEAEQEGVAPDSWFERLIERCVASPLLPSLVRQHEVRDAQGRFVGRLDAALPSIRLGLEAHSRRFHMGAKAESSDEHRDLRLAAGGWEILYLGWQSTKRPEDLLAVVLAVAAGRTPA